MYTPWGASGSSETYAPGITFYGTPSHGGIHLSAARREELAQTIGLFSEMPVWYEEDCDWAIPYAFLIGPTGKDYEAAKRTLLNWHPGAYLALMGGSIAVEQSFVLRDNVRRGADALAHYSECEICDACPRPTTPMPLVTFA